MCGINGYMQFNNKLNSNQIFNLITAMNDKIIHRGPDEDGIFIKENVGLGMRRLSIIDLSTGKQPIYNKDQSMVIVFNGEIYNYKAVRYDLIEKGHTFTTTSDTEVALHAFEEYGISSVSILKGMFVFAIYDIKQNKLIIIRDRAGEKPLYYYKDSNMLIFASELKSILASNLIKKEINKEALCQYLQLTYIPAPMTILKNVYKLQAGYYMEVTSTGVCDLKQYWDLKYHSDNLILDYDLCKKV